jgi:hypothetical protein
MLTQIALSFLQSETNTSNAHDAADFDNLMLCLSDTPCILLVDGESYEGSALRAQIELLRPKEKYRLNLLLRHIPIRCINQWDGNVDGSIPPFKHHNQHLVAVSKETFIRTFGFSEDETSVIAKEAPATEICMWKAIRSSKTLRDYRNFANADIEPKMRSQDFWDTRIGPVISGIKWQTLTVIDRYFFGSSNNIEFPDLRPLRFFLQQLDRQNANRIRLRIVFEADVCANPYNLDANRVDEITKIAELVSRELKNFKVVMEIDLYAFRRGIMAYEYHERFLYLRAQQSLLYSFEIGKGFMVFQNEECKDRSSFHFQAFMNLEDCKRFQKLESLRSHTDTTKRGTFGDVAIYANTKWHPR